MNWRRIIPDRVADAAGALLAPLFAAGAAAYARRGARRLPLSYSVWDRFGVSPIRFHYYEPIFDGRALPDALLRDEVPLDGIDFRLEAQLSLLRRLGHQQELAGTPLEPTGQQADFHFHNGFFESGDAELLYSVLRHFKPRRMFEIGSGHSTKLAARALARNRAEGRPAEHVCIEPYEAPWLERIPGVRVHRQSLEQLDLRLFDELSEGDVLFIDSSHVLRTGGDVYLEYLRILPRLRPGVLIHVHDIFLPHEYPESWLRGDRHYWTEQYLLQAFLSFNSSFEVLLAAAFLRARAPDELAAACPVWAVERQRVPGSFWMRRQR